MIFTIIKSGLSFSRDLRQIFLPLRILRPIQSKSELNERNENQHFPLPHVLNKDEGYIMHDIFERVRV